MIKRIIAVVLLVCILTAMTSCSMRSAEGLIRAFAQIFHIGGEPDPDPAPPDHECIFKARGDDRVKLVKCSVEGCDRYGRPDDDGSFAELIDEYKDFSGKKKEIFDFCDRFSDLLAKAPKYDHAKHAYKKGSKLEKESAEAVKMAEKLDEYYDYVRDVFNAVDLFYFSDVSEYGDLYKEAEEFSDEFEKRYYELEIASYECAYREYLYPESEGWTEDVLSDEIEYAEVHSKDELIGLVDAIQDISYKIDQLPDTHSSDDVCDLYAQLIDANNEMARYLGYDDYYAYAMENEYGREYSIENIESFTELVKDDLVPLMWSYYMNYSELPDQVEGDFKNSVLYGSFLDDPVACEALYGFLKRVEAVQPDGEISYYDSANDAFKHGNLVYSDSENVYKTAYTDYLYEKKTPMMFFSDMYSDVQSYVHEHGHYHAALTESADPVSYDFNEIQSQGAELLYTAYLEEFFDEKGEKGYKDAVTEMIAFDLLTVVYSLADDEFERALYSGDFDGINDPDKLLSDGVTPDEYDYLYACILEGYDFEYGDSYWRNTVTKSPCYYISYAVSMVTSLEIFAEAKNRGFDAGAAAYLGLFECPLDDGYEDKELSDIEYFCKYAGLGSPFEQASYNEIKNALR